MGTIQAKRFKEALQKVRKVGRIEETVTISDCEMVIQNLTLDEYSAAMKDCEGLAELEYLVVYQTAQVARSLVEFDGQDLRDATFIEDEVPTGHFKVEFAVPSRPAAEAAAEKLKELSISPTITQADSDNPKTVKFERHTWILNNVIQHWGREAIAVAWRKLTELYIKADQEAQKGVQFSTPDETPEDRLRRCIQELQEVEADLPTEFMTKILGEFGFIRKSSVQELESVNTQLQAVPQQASVPTPVPAPAPAPVSAAPVQPVAPLVQERVAPADFEPPEAIRNAMQARQRMNLEGSEIPVPVPPVDPVPVSASPRPQVPDAIRRSAQAAAQSLRETGQAPVPSPVPEGISTRRTRSQQIAELESMALDSDETGVMSGLLPGRQAEFRAQDIATDPHKMSVDSRPPAQINSKFNPRRP